MNPLTVTDAMGAKTLTCAQAQAYHAARHGPGVTLAWRFFEVAWQALGLTDPARASLMVDLSVTPPGITDAVEFLTRAVSRNRLQVRPPQGCSCGSCESIVFGLTVGGARVQAKVRDGVVPAGFPEAQKRDEAGFVAGSDLEALWKRRAALDEVIATAAIDHLFEITVTPGDVGSPAQATGPTPALTDPVPVVVRDLAGEHPMTLVHALAFHDGDHFGGVVLAHKLLQMVGDGAALDRNTVTILTGLTPPGLMDTFELLVRGTSRHRVARLPAPPVAPASPFGVFAFRVLTSDRDVTLRLKDGLLPADFAEMGRLCLAGTATEDQAARFAAYKRDVAVAIVGLAPTDLLEPVTD
ncbi:hypothetical protein [Rhodospira trueperi]|uniref:Uncharacterized protein n=1 Tax=Rhodospira trueperi TaxID=69960 RepID=A0A1G7HTT4_9PROT|nr:hypothetical protein [Rhodospira trueperi]SDF03733.1 hypothetical protein SAMN05421720_12514 [Rhodospira trueperi]